MSSHHFFRIIYPSWKEPSFKEAKKKNFSNISAEVFYVRIASPVGSFNIAIHIIHLFVSVSFPRNFLLRTT